MIALCYNRKTERERLKNENNKRSYTKNCR